MDELFAPDRIALVGATDREESVGLALWENLTADFQGSVVPVNPTRDCVFDTDCYDSLSAAPTVDLAVVAVPPDAVAEVIENAGDNGIEYAVVITAGFAEIGGEGEQRQQELVAVAQDAGVSIVGPNSLGIMSTPVGMNASFGPHAPDPGPVSFYSQSGAFVTAAVDWARELGLGFRHVASIGNAAVLDDVDFLGAWGEDPDSKVILGYVEGIERGRTFLKTARAVTQNTPVVLIKSGCTAAGAEAAASHTGAMAGRDEVYEAAFDQAGVHRAPSAEEFFDYGRSLAWLPALETPTVGVVTNAGGPGVMTTDAIGDGSLELATFADETRAALTESLPAEADASNPVDVVGDADVARFRQAIEQVLSDSAVGSLIVVAAPTAVLEYESLAREITTIAAESEIPICCCLMGGEDATTARRILADADIPTFFDPARAVRSLDALETQRQVRHREYVDPPEFDDIDHERARAILGANQNDGQAENQTGGQAGNRTDDQAGNQTGDQAEAIARNQTDSQDGGQTGGQTAVQPGDQAGAIARNQTGGQDGGRSVGQIGDQPSRQLGVEALDLLDAYGIPTPGGQIVEGSDEAATVAKRLDGPVVLKLVSQDISHKTDVGGVVTDVDPADAASVYDTIISTVREERPEATIAGVLVQEQVDTGDATETIVGTKRDPQFGQSVLFGLGGIFVETLKDTTLRVGPITRREAAKMVSEIDAYPLIAGSRGRPPADEDAIVETIVRISRLVEDFPEIAELDINPLVAGPDGVTAVDLRVTVDTPDEAEADHE